MKKLLTLSLLLFALLSCKEKSPIHYEISLGKVPMTAVFTNGDDNKWTVWGASMVKDEEGLYHMFYSRWKKGFGWSWVVDSEIAHATSTSPYGPWEFSDVTLPRRGKEHWDGWCTHNPTIHKFDGKYYLYYMGNTGDGENPCTPGKYLINWQHRNNQRIGVAVADSPYGPWTRFDKPLIDVSSDPTAHDALMTSNPSVCKMDDGKFLFVYKAVCLEEGNERGGAVVHLAATADSPTGPIKKHPNLVFNYEGERFPAEDPYIWYQDGLYRAIVKRMASGKEKRQSLKQFESKDGIHWAEAKYGHISNIEINWEDGTYMPLKHLERPQLYIENGKPILLLCAADTIDENNVLHSFNVQIPINITEKEPYEENN